MRICLYTETALPVMGGQELAVDALARQFIALGHEPSVLTLKLRQGNQADDRSFPYPVARHRRYFSTRHLLEFYCWSLERHFRKHRFDVLHCQNVYPAGYVGIKWARVRQVPLVITSHACDIGKESHLLKKPRVITRVRCVIQQANKIISISDPLTARFRELGASDDQIVTIANGVDVAQFEKIVPRPAHLEAAIQPGSYFLFLGRLVERKGADLLLAAFQRIAGSTDANVVIAGAGPELEGLRRLAATVLNRRVFFPGMVSGAVKAYLLQNGICTVIPSRISEGSSLVGLETYAAGRPLVGTTVPGLTEAIRPQETGLLVPPDSPTALAEALLQLDRHPALARRWGEAGRQSVRQYDWKNIAARYLAVYTSLYQSVANRLAA